MINLFFIFLCLICASCDRQFETSCSRPQVLVSIPPYRYFVEKIAGDTVEVATLLPEGVSPHTYEPTPKEVERAMKTRLWIRLGESFDKKIHRILTSQPSDMRVVEVTEGLPLITTEGCCHHHKDSTDLHVWLSPKLVRPQVEAIAQALMDLCPEFTDIYRANLTLVLKELDELDHLLTDRFAQMEQKVLLTSHAAFAYLCRDYDLQQLSIEVDGKEALPQHLNFLIADAKEKKAKVMLVEPQYSIKSAVLLAEHLNLPVRMIDPYSSDYPNNLKKIAEAITGS